MLTWKIAWRNLWRHKGKSLVIGIIIFLGALFMTVGNAVIEGAKQGLEKNMINRFTGHLILAAAKEKKENVFFAFRNILGRSLISKKELSLILGVFSKTNTILGEMDLYEKE